MDSELVLLEFIGELLERIFLDYVSYRVSTYERVPLRCYWCQEHGHVVAAGETETQTNIEHVAFEQE